MIRTLQFNITPGEGGLDLKVIHKAVDKDEDTDHKQTVTEETESTWASIPSMLGAIEHSLDEYEDRCRKDIANSPIGRAAGGEMLAEVTLVPGKKKGKKS